MKNRVKFTTFLVASLLLFGGCAKELDEYNKPALYWYGKIVDSIANNNIDKADNYYSSLQGEHIGSPLLPDATMIMAIAHMEDEDYLLAEHFLSEFTKRYATKEQQEFAEFLKLRASYMALPNPRRDQHFIKKAIVETRAFKKQYPNSIYYTTVDTMLTNLLVAEALLNESIALLYDRIDKTKSADYYRSIKPKEWIKWSDINRENTPWYREWFEGDGTDSWYAFLIPDTQSVVSRNSNREDKDEAK